MRDKVEELKAVAKEYMGVFTWFLLNVAAVVLIVFVGAYATFLKPILAVIFAFRNETLTISMIFNEAVKIFLLCPLSLLAGMFCLTFPNDIACK